MGKQNNLYYSYSPVTQELMITTVDSKNLDKVENVMLDTDHYLQIDPKTKETKGFFVLFVDPESEKEEFHKFPQKSGLNMLDFKKITPLSII